MTPTDARPDDQPQGRSSPKGDSQTSSRREGDADAAPQMPPERDESPRDAPAPPDAKAEQAHEDLAQGQQDTDRGAVADEAYRKQKR